MDTDIIILIINALVAIITIIYVVLLYETMKISQNLNKHNIFNDIVKQERELRIKLLEYRDIINNIKINIKKRQETKLDYDTLLFNFYEFLAICIYKGLIDNDKSKIFFKSLVESVKEMFDLSLLFREGYAKQEQYKGLQWLFRKWKI